MTRELPLSLKARTILEELRAFDARWEGERAHRFRTGVHTNCYDGEAGVSGECDIVPRGPAVLLTPERRGHCVDSRGVSP